MSMQVLQSRAQIDTARATLDKRGLSQLRAPSALGKLLRRLHIDQSPLVGDRLKSWDVLTTIEYLEANVARDAPILDIGCYASEVVVALHDAGFTNLSGIDLDPRLNGMPHARTIRYVNGDFLESPFSDASFSAVTSISVIEHGFDADRLASEMSRILLPDGYFIASFDYWPDKVNTGSKRFFDMDWLIFSREDVERFITVAAGYGLKPAGPLRFESSDHAIAFEGFDYTFGWLALKKQA